MPDHEGEFPNSGIAKQFSQRLIHNMQNEHQELEDLHPRCEQLKKERTDIAADLVDRSREQAKLQAEIGRLTLKRDTLRTEVTSWMKKAARYDAEFLTPTSAAATPGTESESTFDEKGRMKRRIWVLEQTLNDKDLKLARKDGEREKAVDKEMAISVRLRGRIETLEAKIRTLTTQVKDGLKREKSLKGEVEFTKGVQSGQAMAAEERRGHLTDQLLKERQEKKTLEAELSSLKEWKIEAEEELRSLREPREIPKSPNQFLQPKSTIANPEPRTPTKQPFSSRNPNIPSSPSFSPTTNLAKRYAYLEDRHELLKKEYDKLRTGYSNDLRHWKEYKAVEMARIDLKKQRKAEKREAKEKQKGGKESKEREVTQKEEELVAASDLSQSLSQPIPDWHVAEYRDNDTVVLTSDPARPRDDTGERLVTTSPLDSDQIHTSDTIGRPKNEKIDPKDYEMEYEITAGDEQHAASHERAHDDFAKEQDLGRNGQLFAALESANDIPSASPSTTMPHVGKCTTPVGHSIRAATTSAARTTPWLGAASPQRSSASATKKGKRGTMHLDDKEIFEDYAHLPSPGPSSGAHRTPLVRDRGVDAASSLRRTALRKNTAAYEESTPIKDESKRRKVEIEAMTPVEKAAEMKRIKKMSTSEKKAYYAGYKGKGRYLPPEELRTRVYDEYEIDPAQNEGVGYQFHDVKRRREERRQMHGGDCECCKDYYEAVGPLPRYNQAPKWNDAGHDESSTSTTKEAELQEHQNKVSRHRETWRRAPTPPGFWQIGFPTTQDVKEQNALADEMTRKKEEQVRREAAHRDSKWRKKA